jgi:capsular exopolysaccharide synthesis family protein
MEIIDTHEKLAGVEQEFNLKKYIFKLLKRWPIILSFFLLSVLCGYLINRYSTPVYEVSAKITTHKFSDKPANPVPGLVDANFFLSGLTEVYEEIPLLLSPKRIEATIDKLDFRVSYFARGLIKTSVEINKGFGFDVRIDSITGSNYPFNTPIFVNHTSKNTFEIEIENEEWAKKLPRKEFSFGVPLVLGDAMLTIENTNGITAESNKYYFVLNRKSDLVNQYRSRLEINWTMPGSSMLDLRIETESPEKDLRFLNAFYEVVVSKGMEEKNETLDNTIRFIDDQMAMVTDSLIYYQQLTDEMKLDNRKLNLGSEFIYSKLNEIDEKRAVIALNDRYLNYLTDYFVSKRESDVFAPSLVGLDVPVLEQWVNEFIGQKLKDKYDRNDRNVKNPLVNREDSLRRKLEKGIYEAIKNERQRNRIAMSELDQSENSLFNSVQGVQTDFRELSRYQRMYQLNQTLFDLFLRRKTEAAISKASATSDYKIIEAPYYSRLPIKPDKDKNLAIAAALGLVLPVAFFFVKDLTNSRIMDRDDLQVNTQIPMLGNVAHSIYDSKSVIRDHPRSVVAESFRAVRANLKYLLANSKTGTFLITSCIGGEGKTFCSFNLACTLAISDKKTLLIGADMRKPQPINLAKKRGTRGLSEFLAGLATLEEVLVQGEKDMPDFIEAGNIPPNPSELLASPKMAELVSSLKQRYDFILIDTPPIGLVSDAMELFKFTDFNILIVRQKVTHKAALRMINELYLDGKLGNFTVLFNDIELVKHAGKSYGGYLYGMGYSGYGYGYYQEDSRKLNS